MRLHASMALAFLSAAVAGCSSQQAAAPAPVTSATTAPMAPATRGNNGSAAVRCTAPFRYNEQFFVTMTTSNEGAACSVNAFATRTGSRGGGGVAAHFPYTDGTVTDSPQHGAVAFHFTPTASYIDYTPVAGYVGTDHFKVSMLPGTRGWDVSVRVVAR